MAKEQETKIISGINYIEPNLIHSIQGDDGTYYEVTPNMEDYCVVVNLGVTIQGKRYAVADTEGGNKVIMSWNTSEGTVNFMQGTKIYYDTSAQSGEYINSLTTDYADMSPKEYLTSKGKSTTTELFGIESIDINYDNYYVPQVTVHFVDVRGMSLFMPEEYRHGKTVGGIDGFADDDIAGSFFKSFFTFPYPKFDLMVKGIYGKPVTFELSVVDWKATFDCDRGSFGCTVNFIGYSYALLSDLTLNAIIAASESDYVGREYFKSNSEYVYHEGVKIKTFNEFLQAYQESQVHLEKVAANSELAKRVENLTIEINKLNIINNSIGNFITECRKQVELNLKTKNPFYYVANGSSDCYICFKDAEDEIPSEIKNAYNRLTSVLEETNFNFGNAPFEDWVQKVTDNQSNQKQYKTIQNSGSKQANFSFLNNLTEDSGIKASDYKYFVAVYFYDLQKQITKKLDENNKEIEALNAELAKQKNDIIRQYIGFNPDIENLIRMFCAHIDTFLHCVFKASSSAISDTSGRHLSNPGESSDYTGNTVPAFPKVVTQMPITDPDRTTSSASGNTQYVKYEDAWIGDLMEGAPEADLIDGLLNGIKLINQTVQETEEVLQNIDNSYRNGKLKVPIVPYDFLSNDSVFFKSGEVLQESMETYARIALRAFTVLAASTVNSNIDLIGKADAINFYHMVGNNISSTFKEKVKKMAVQSDINDNSIIDNIKYGDNKIFITDVRGNITINKDANKFIINSNDNSYFFPLSNVSFASLKPAYQYDNEDVMYFNAYSDKHKRYCFAILNEEESNILISRYTNAPSLGSAADTDAYRALYPEMELDMDTLNEKYYDGNEENIINNIFRSSQDGNMIQNFFTYIWESIKPYYARNTEEIKGNIFGHYLYYYNTDNVTKRSNDTEKAVMFLESLVSIDETKNFINWIIDPTKGIISIPKIILVYCGALIELAKGDYKQAKYFSEHFGNNSNQILRKEVVDALLEYYKNWETSYETDGFQFYKDTFELPESFIDSIRNGEIKKEDLQSNFDRLEDNIYNIKNSGKTCETGKAFKIEMELKGTDSTTANAARNNLRKLLDKKVTIVKSTNNTAYNERSPIIPSTNRGNMTAYFNAFFKKLSELYNGDEDEEATNSNVQDPNIIKDVKISLYNYIKLMYDRWLCGRKEDALRDWSYSALLNRFIIIDSFYFKIGKNVLFDIRKFFNRMRYSLEQNTYSMASFINDVLSDNDMLFLSIQNFADLSNPDFMKEMFTPIPYRKMGYVTPQTNFICLYTHKSSNHLNIPNSDFADDSFMLNDKENITKTIPYVVANRRTENSYDIPSFGVTYGKQYQSYFLRVDPSMESPIMTEQSLKAQYLLQQEASDSAKKIKFYGQDLYTVYSNNSYTCTVEMLGCAWVQPLMYFVLLNIPMFRGSYLIQQVSHHIEQGKMTTRFIGTRMSRTCTPYVKEAVGVQDNTANGSDTNNRLGSDDTNTSNDRLSSCAYEEYAPQEAVSQIQNESNVIKEPSFYDDTLLQDLGISDLKGRGSWTLRQGLTFIAQKEAGSEGKLGKQLVVTVCLNRAANQGWNMVFNEVQLNGWGVSGGAPANDADVDEILTNGPYKIIGETAIPAEPIEVYSQSQYIGTATNVELTKDNLSKIYMFNNLSGYASAKQNGGANPIKTTKYAFTHNHHVFHYGPNTNSDTSFWKESNTAQLSKLEESLSSNKNVFGVYCAIKLSAKNSSHIQTDIQIAEILDESKNSFTIKSNDNGKMHLIYDMILDTYSQYISDLGWIMKTQSDYASPTPAKILITVGNGAESRNVYMGYIENGQVNRQNNALTLAVVSQPGVNVNFLGSIAKHYNTVAGFQNDCPNFNKSESEAIFNYLHNENIYGFSCDGGTVSKFYGNPDGDNIESNGLPSKIYFPVQYVANGQDGVLNNPVVRMANYSGHFHERREVKDRNGNVIRISIHEGIDIGTGGDADMSMIAIWDGQIVYLLDSSYGSPWFVIRHANCVSGNKVLHTRYLHGIGSNIYVGRNVVGGEVLGRVAGVSGYSIHLHIEFSFFEGNYTQEKFKKGLVDPSKLYEFGNYKDSLANWVDTLGNRV